MEYLNAFLCGGLLCAIGQILIDRTQLTPARILTGYVVAGVLLQAVGVYQYLVDWGGAGATVPLTGFGYTLAKGVAKAVAERGLLDGHLRRHHRGGRLRRPRRPPLQARRQTITEIQTRIDTAVPAVSILVKGLTEFAARRP